MSSAETICSKAAVIVGILLCAVVWAAGGCGEQQSGSDTAMEAAAAFKPAGEEDAVNFDRDYFLPVKFRPIADDVAGLKDSQISLDGTWRINPKPQKDFSTDVQRQTGEGDGWSDFTVPGQWLQQGFEIPEGKWWQSGEWWFESGRPANDTAIMVKEFDIPESWSGKRIFLRFDAIHGGTTYWLNGKKLGCSENLFTPVEFDITAAALPGERNRLVLATHVATISELLSCSVGYAYHNLGGIDRSVRIFALPQLHISRLHYATPLDAEYRDAVLSLDVSIDNPTDEAATDLSLRFKLTDPSDKTVDLQPAVFSLQQVGPGENRFSPKLPVTNPAKWNAEKPALYKLTVELYQGRKLLEKVVQDVGFRQVEVKDRQIYLNGRLIKLLGACHHEVHPLKGRAGTSVFAEQDVSLFREANMNYLRTSHYPPTREFLEACDRQGMYVECEAPFCWVQPRHSNDPQMLGQFLTATAAMLEYHRNHPSVLIWSIVNESPMGAGLEKSLDLLKREDTSRLRVSNGEAAETCNLDDYHYTFFPCDGNGQVVNGKRPAIFDEYFPPMSLHFAEELNLNPGLDVTWSENQNSPDSYISQIHHSKHVVGGAIWAALDDEFYFADGSVHGYGQWGLIDTWRRKKSMFWDDKIMHSPVWIPVRDVVCSPGQKTVRIPVENRYSFTNLSEVTCTWELDGAKGKVAMDIAPRAAGEIEIPLCSDPIGRMVTLDFTDAKGRLIVTRGVRLRPPSKEYFSFPELWNGKTASITMDGKFADWQGIEPLTAGQYAEPVGDAGNGNDIEDVRLAADEENLYLSVRCSKAIGTPGGWSPTFIAIDADCDDATGLTRKPLGVDYLVQPYSSDRTDYMLHVRDPQANNSNWGGWTGPVIVKNGYMVGAGDDASRVEIRIPWKNIGVKDVKSARLRFRIADGAVNMDDNFGEWVPSRQGQFYVMPVPEAGCPKMQQDDGFITVEGDGWEMKINRSTGGIERTGKAVALLELPGPFFNRAEFLGMKCQGHLDGVPYTEYPDRSTRAIKSISAEPTGNALAISYQEQYRDFTGGCEILIDKAGLAAVSYDYEYSGAPFTASEAGLYFLMNEACRQIRWKRNAEWNVYPDDNLGRPEGQAVAHNGGKWRSAGRPPYMEKPDCPWYLDENRFGTRDFRCGKYHIYLAELLAADGSGMRVNSNGTTTDVRANLADKGVEFHVLDGFKPARGTGGGFCPRFFRYPKAGYKLSGSFSVQLLPASGK